MSDSVTSDVRDCYGALADQDKARVFEAMAKLQGISLNNSAKEAPYLTGLEPEGLAPEGINWQQLVERTPFSAVGKQLISASGAWYSATACDQNPLDIDYIFLFNFPSAVTNPDALRNFSSNLQVDAMLVYYQVRYGGLNGFGNTDSSRAYVCVGNTGLNTAGGITNVYNNMKLHR